MQNGANSNILRQRIRERLQELGLSQRAASLKAGKSPDLIRDLMRRPANSMLAGNLERVANALETTVGYLLGETEEAAPSGGLAAAAMESGELRPAIRVLERLALTDLEEDIAPSFRPGENTVYPSAAVRDGFAFRIADESMADRFRPGDIVIVDRAQTQPRPGDYVVALLTEERELLFRRYHQRLDADRHAYAELAPENSAWPTRTVGDWRNPGRIIGTMVEHRRVASR